MARPSGAWLNDADPAIAALWSVVLERPDALCEEIHRFQPSVEAFYRFKAALLVGTIRDPVELALAKLAVHQISFSGLGVMSGGPLGGREQRVGGIGSRWNPDTLCRDVRRDHRAMVNSRAVVSNVDFQEVLEGCGKALVYLDPPYYEKGQQLYQYAFRSDDHVRLAASLRRTANPWILSYDDAPQVREMYAFAQVLEMRDLNYSINTQRVRGELLILSPNMPNLFDQVADKRKYAGGSPDIFAE